MSDYFASVENLVISQGQISAKVITPMSRPYEVVLHNEVWNKEQWNKVLIILASEASYTAALLNSELPIALESKLNQVKLSLIIEQSNMQSSCTCQQANTGFSASLRCEHVALVHDTLLQTLEHDPILIFELKGMDKEQLLHQLRLMRSTISDVSDHANEATTSQESFKHYGEADQPVMTLLGDDDDPGFWPKEMTLHTMLRPIYTKVSKRANAILVSAHKSSIKRGE